MRIATAVVLSLVLAACAAAAPATPAPATLAPATPTPAPPDPTPTPPSQPTPALPTEQPTPEAPTLTVVATTTVLADMVRQVGGDRVEVHSLVPQGVDVHTFDPSPSDAIRVSQADLLVMNGVGLDEWLARFAVQAGAQDVPVVELAEDLPGVIYLEGHDHHDDERREDEHDENEHDDEEDKDEHAYNPHLWLNVAYARLYVDRIADALAEADPAGDAAYRANSAAYDARLAELDDWIRAQLATIPVAQRRVVSFHDAFPYFAAAYDVEIVGVLVDSPGREPSPAEVAQLIDAIRASGVRLILAESQFSDRLAQTVAAETGAQVINDLLTDTLGAPPLDTFDAAMRWNVERIIEGLR